MRLPRAIVEWTLCASLTSVKLQLGVVHSKADAVRVVSGDDFQRVARFQRQLLDVLHRLLPRGAFLAVFGERVRRQRSFLVQF